MGHYIHFEKQRKKKQDSKSISKKRKYVRTSDFNFDEDDGMIKEDVGYLSYSMGMTEARLIYKAFDVARFDMGCSGSGEVITLTEFNVARAIQYYENLSGVAFKYEIQELNKILHDMTQPSLKGFANYVCGISRKDWTYSVCFC